MATTKKTPTQIERDLEAASFMLQAIDIAHRIQSGKVSSATVSYSKRRRERGDHAIDIKLTFDNPDVDPKTITPMSIERATQLINDRIKEQAA